MNGGTKDRNKKNDSLFPTSSRRSRGQVLIPDSQFKKGVTLIELLLIISIIALLGATMVPLGSGFLIRNNLRNKTNEVVSSLKTARLNSLSGKENSFWGVSITSSSITMFKGQSYLNRDASFDQKYQIPTGLTLSPTEIIFEPVTGNPDGPTSIAVSTGSETNLVQVNEVGVVDVQ